MKITLFISLLLLSSIHMLAQTNNSPYSVIGIGDIEDSYYGRITTGLANTGIAYRNNHNLIGNNPAAYSALDNQFFAGEMAIRMKLVNYFGSNVDPADDQSSDITFKRVSFGTKITNHWGSAVGLMPFSSQNYQFISPLPIGGTNGATTNAYSEGNGGINKVFWANSYDFFNHISIGVNASYLFGSLSQKTILLDVTGASLTSTTSSSNVNNLYIDYGIQAYGKLGKRWSWAIGGTFANQTDLNSSSKILILSSDSGVLKDETIKQSYITIPNTYGVGISLTKDRKYTFLADYRYQAWTPLHYSGLNYSLENSNRLSAGFEVSNLKTAYGVQYETSYLQAGVYYGDSYLRVYGETIKDMGVTAGFGVNSKRSPMGYTVTFQYGVKGTQAKQLIEERYFNMTIMLSFRDLWYTKGRKYD